MEILKKIITDKQIAAISMIGENKVYFSPKASMADLYLQNQRWWVTKPLPGKGFSNIKFWFQNLMLPESFIKFMEWSETFGYISEGIKKEEGFFNSDIWIGRIEKHNYLGQYLEIFFEERKPLEFRRVLMLGFCDKARVGMWLREDGKEGEIIMFENMGKNSYVYRDKFFLLASSFTKLVERITYCAENNICMNLLNPNQKELKWIEENEVMPVYPEQLENETLFTFKNPKNFLEHWKVKDYLSEIKFLNSAIDKKNNYKSRTEKHVQGQLMSYLKRYKGKI